MNFKVKMREDDSSFESFGEDLQLVHGKDGHTPVKGVDYYTEEDKAELVEEVLEQIPEQPSGGISVDKAQIGQTIVVKAVDESGKPTEWEAAELGGAAIIDVIELPTENIEEDSFYRLLTGTFVYNQFAIGTHTCLCVDGLPEVGEPAADVNMTQMTMYYNVQDGELYGYVDDVLSGLFGSPAGWYPAAVLMGAAGYVYNGTITDIEDDPRDSTFRILLEYVIWQWKEEWVSLKSVGKVGAGFDSAVFNHPANEARGEASLAEGFKTSAVGNNTHAEGEGTVAASSCQHAQGKYNIEDSEGKYAHIVGNGANRTHRSNAHTLDWSGLGWFAGGLKVGGTGQDDENAKRVLTEDDIVQPDWNQNDESQPDYVKNRPFYEVPTNYEITWDGDMTGRTAIDLSSMWQEGVYLVKVSDRVYTKEELVGKYFTANYLQAPEKLYAYSFEDPFPGVFVESGYMLAVAYSADEFYAATGINVTNGTYFACAPSVGRYVSALYTDGRIEKLEDKFLPDTALRRVYIDIPNGDMANKLECVLDGGWSECNVTFGEGSPWGESHSNLYGKELCVPVSVRVSENSYLGHKCLFSPMYNTASVGSCYSVLNINAVGTLVQTFVRIADSGTIYVAAKTVDI